MAKNRIRKIIAASLFLISFISKVNAQSTLDYHYANGNQKATIEVQSEDNFLKTDRATKVLLKLENIAPETITVSAPNMKMLMKENTENSIMLEITAKSEFVENGTFPMHISGKTNGEFWSHKFVIAVK